MMDAWRELVARLRSFFRKSAMDDELNQELAAHLELAIDENIRQGMPAAEARRQALIRFGGMDQAREQHREARGLPGLEILLQDLRYAVRTLRRDRAFTLVAVLILGLGIGSNVAVFSVVNAVLLRPLPFHHPERLVWIEGINVRDGLSGKTFPVSISEGIERHSRSLQALTSYFAFYEPGSDRLTLRGERLPVSELGVAGNFFRMLGVSPVLGRDFTTEESQKNGRPAVLLSHAFWQRQFASNPAIVGQTIELNDRAVTVVGVLPTSFDFGSVFAPGTKIDLYAPIPMDQIRTWGNTLSLIGRLKPGMTVAEAQAEFNVLLPELSRLNSHAGPPEASVTTLKQHVSGNLRRSLIVLWCAVGLVLLIVCVNLSNLLLARAATRTKEFAVRSALGAGPGRLIRQLLTESLVLASGGAVLGLGLAWAMVRWLEHSASIAIPLLQNIQIDGAALAWTLLITASAAMLFGIVPSLKIAKGSLLEGLKESGRGMSEGRRHEKLRASLVVSEVALACVLLTGAGLLLRSFIHLLDMDPGFQPSHAAALKIDYSDGGDGNRRGAVLQGILHRVDAIPGIDMVGVTDALPLDRNRSWGFWPKGKVYTPEDLPSAFVYIVTPGYLRAMGVHWLEGRDLQWSDGASSQPVAVIDQTTARRLWPGEDALGRIGIVNGRETRVVGIIADVREDKMEGQTGMAIYLPVMQAGPMGAELVYRTRMPLDTMAVSILNTLRSLNPNQPATQYRPLQELVDHAISPRRFFVLLVTSFALLGLLLASLGIYGVISYSVMRQTQEIGVRMALGATAGRVQRSVIGKTLRLVLLGIAMGTIASLGVAQLIASLLFGTAPTDPVTFAGMVLLLSSVALLAGYLPARRASHISPMVALREE